MKLRSSRPSRRLAATRAAREKVRAARGVSRALAPTTPSRGRVARGRVLRVGGWASAVDGPPPDDARPPRQPHDRRHSARD